MRKKDLLKKANQYKRKIFQKARVVQRFFVRNGRKFIRFFVRRKRDIERFWIRTKRSKGKNIKDQIIISKRNLLYRIFTDKEFFKSIEEQVNQIPESNGSRFYEPYNYRIAIIADEFLYNSFKGIADFVYITPENYKEVREKVEFLLVVSAWRGLNNEWRQMGTIGSNANLILHEAISYYKEGGKKIVFYSKEDPPNYQHFLPIAQRCDIIFTSAYEKIESYKKDCGINEVYTMKFGINPAYHNPVGIHRFPKRKEVIFSGSWVKKYPDRIRALAVIFDGVLKSGHKLKIIDRNYELVSPGFFFPNKYIHYISPSIKHEYLQKTHKLFDWAININSVTDSKTMFANRVYELQAAGNLLLSNSSIGVEEQFEGVFIIREEDDVKQVMNGFNSEEVYERQIAGIRRVMTGETTFDRVGELLSCVGYSAVQPVRKVIVLTHNSTMLLKKQFEEQTYPYKQSYAFEDISSEVWGANDIVAVWDGDCTYGKYYLEDMVNGFKYTSCDYICKDSFYSAGELSEGVEHDYVYKIRNVYATVFWGSSITYQELAVALKENYLEKENGYSIDHFNFHFQEA